MDKEKIISIAGLVLVVGAVVAYSVFDFGKEKAPQVANVPAVASVATVNGVAVPQDKYDTQVAAVVANLRTQGVAVDDPAKLAEIKAQVLNDFINNEIVAQAVLKSGIIATSAEVDAQYQSILTQAGGAEGLKAELVKANLTDAQLRENIAKQLAVQAFLLKNIDTSSVTVSDAEIAAFYKEYGVGKTGVPPLKELSAQIKQQITANKQQVLISNYVATLRAGAKIETTVK